MIVYNYSRLVYGVYVMLKTITTIGHDGLNPPLHV